MKHCHGPLLAVTFLACLPSTRLNAQTFIPHPPRPPHYIVLDTRRLTTVKQELTLVAMQGYRVAYVAPRPGNPLWPAGMTIILEKLPEGASAPEYELVEEKNAPAVHFLLDQPRHGYRYVRNSAFIHRGHDFWGDFWATAVFGEKHVRHEKYDTFTSYILLELSRENAACRYRAQLTDPGREDRSPKVHFAEGFHLVEQIERHLIFENCGDPGPRIESDSGSINEGMAAERYRIVATSDGRKRQKQLTEAVAQGFHLSNATGNILSLARNESPNSSTMYQTIVAKTEPDLEKKLNQARGFRMVPQTLIRRNSFWSGVEYRILMEKIAEEDARYRYRALREKNGNEVQDLLNLLHAKNFEVRGISRDAGGITVLMERAEEFPPAAPQEVPRSDQFY